MFTLPFLLRATAEQHIQQLTTRALHSLCTWTRTAICICHLCLSHITFFKSFTVFFNLRENSQCEFAQSLAQFLLSLYILIWTSALPYTTQVVHYLEAFSWCSFLYFSGLKSIMFCCFPLHIWHRPDISFAVWVCSCHYSTYTAYMQLIT